MTSLDEMRAQRDHLDAVIAKAEASIRDTWNAQMSACEDALGERLSADGTEVVWTTRKNERIADVGNGALQVRFGYWEEHYGPWMQLKSGTTLQLSWVDEVPAVERFLRIVDALLGVEKRDSALRRAVEPLIIRQSNGAVTPEFMSAEQCKTALTALWAQVRG